MEVDNRWLLTDLNIEMAVYDILQTQIKCSESLNSIKIIVINISIEINLIVGYYLICSCIIMITGCG